MLGDFESNMDGWVPASGSASSYSTEGVTHGSNSLEVAFPSGWVGVLSMDMRSQVDFLKTMISFSLDVTTRNDSGQIPGWLGFYFIINSETTGWLQYDLVYPGVPSSPRTDTLTVTIPQSVRDTFAASGTGGFADFIIITNSGSGGVGWFDNIKATTSEPGGNVTINVDAASPIRTIPMTLYGANLASWDGSMAGTNTTFNNLKKASGCKYFRIPGGSWGNGMLWSDIDELYNPDNTPQTWRVNYNEYLNLMSILSQPGEEVHPTLQPIVNFPGCWYMYQDQNGDWQTDCSHGHQAAVDAAADWVADQTSRNVCAEYWEIGNEIGGPWEVGYFPEISGTYYGDYFADFYLAMKAVNPNIKIGACAEPTNDLQPWGWYQGHWDHDLLLAAANKGVVPDFFIIHSYQNGGGDGSASNNPTLLGSQVNDIAQWTSNMDRIISDTLGSAYVGQIGYYMTEWNDSGTDTYNRHSAYIGAMFRAQYILEMARNNWVGSNPWIYDYDGNSQVYPVWYVHPLLINYFGRDMVNATSSDLLVRAYAAEDADGNMTVFIVNNSPTDTLTADINIAGFLAGTGGQQWLVEPAGSLIAGGVNIQDSSDVSINGVVHPNPLTVSSLPSQSVTSGNSFSVTLPASGMMLLKIPAGTGDTTPPAVPTGLTADLDGTDVALDWSNNTEGDLLGYNIYRSTASGNGYMKLNVDAAVNSDYIDDTAAGGENYYYVVTAVDTSWNLSGNSNEVSITIPVTALGTILYERWNGISGGSVASLTSNAAYPDNPSVTDQLTTLEGPTNLTENYGTRIRGYLYPPSTGSYTFWIAGDDNCELWLSTDGTPANAVRIANVTGWTDSREWDKFTSQTSESISLTAGQKYYIEVLHKEYTGGDNIAVAWSGPGLSQAVVDGQYLSPWLIGLYGDFDDNGSVSVEDLALFAANWVSNDCILTSAMDLDGDCVIDFDEFSQFAQNWMR